MRQNGHDREQIADEMAAGIAEERAGLGKIIRQKSDQRAANEKANERDEILAIRRGDEGENGTRRLRRGRRRGRSCCP